MSQQNETSQALVVFDGGDGQVDEELNFTTQIRARTSLLERQQGARAQRPTFSMLLELTRELSEQAQQSDEIARVYGLVAMAIQALKGDSTLAVHGLEEAASTFVESLRMEHQSQRIGLSQDSLQHWQDSSSVGMPQLSQESAVLPPLAVPQRTRGTTKRLKSSVEIRRDIGRKSKKAKTTCTFCDLPGHNKANCSVYKELGVPVKGAQESMAVVDNLTNLQSVLSENQTIGKSINTSLPSFNRIQSIVYHGSFKMQDGTLAVGVSVMAKGRIRHAQFPEEGEPHLLERTPAISWLIHSGGSKSKISFVTDGKLTATPV